MSEPSSDPSSPALTLPSGYVDREEAARISGLGITAWERWEAQGKVTCGQWLKLPGGGRRRVYPIEAIQQIMREHDLSFPPPGMMEHREAARLFGVSQGTICHWEKHGRITCGRVVSIPGKPGQYRIYPVEELQRLKEQWDQEKEQSDRQLQPYPDPDRPGVARVPVASNIHKGLEALIEVADLPLVQGKRWNWSCRRRDSLLSGWVVWSGTTTPLTRIIMGLSDPSLLVSHVNGDHLDCRRENLIVRTRSEVRRAAKRPKKWERFEPYPDPDRTGVVRVPVCSEKHKGMEALIDAADLPLVQGKRWNWSAGHSGQPGSPGGGTVILAMGGTPKPSLTRILLGIDDPEQLVAHRNGDRLDCRRENLVVRTRQQVRRGAKKMLAKAGRACSSRFKGVSRTDNGRKWSAMINIDRQSRYLGVFRSEIDAALAYDAALGELLGQDTAGLNFPDPAEAERLRALEPVVEEDPTWPPPGMVERHEACRMFDVSFATWRVWEKQGRITCGQLHSRPDHPGQRKLYPKDELERARVEIEKLGKPYPDPERPGVWRVPLKGYLKYREALIDEADLSIVEGKNWNWSERSDGAVAGTVILATTRGFFPLHRLIADVTDPKIRVSFANGDPLDLRRENLLVRSLAEMTQSNRKMSSRAGLACTSQFKGVSRHADRDKWVAQIRRGGVGLNLGRFDSETDAARAYDAAARVLFGEHGHLNLPEEPSTEQAMAEARAAMNGVANQKRVQRRRQRDLERKLRRAAVETKDAQYTKADGDAAMIARDVAIQLFDVSRAVWRRWRRFGWLPPHTKVNGRTMYALAEMDRLLRRCGLTVLPYPDPQRPGVYRVPLAGDTAHGREALIDADALTLVQTRRWRFAVAEDSQRGGDVQGMDPAEKLRLHHVVMGISADESLIGFRNDDPLDCRRANLVLRDHTLTNAHHRKQATFRGRPCTSRFKGVCWDQRRERWVANIKKNGVHYRLGSFRDEIAAAEAYDEAARDLFGEHARLNFPAGVDARLEVEATLLRESDAAPSDRARAA